VISTFNDAANGRFGADLQYLRATFNFQGFDKGDLVARCQLCAVGILCGWAVVFRDF